MSQNKAHNFNIHKNLYKGTKKRTRFRALLRNEVVGHEVGRLQLPLKLKATL